MSQCLFVLPLDGMVFFPTTTVPLQIYEPKYVELIKDAVASQTPIALTFNDPLQPDLQTSPSKMDGSMEDTGVVVGYGQPTIIQENEDGSLLVALQGQGKARLTHVMQERPYIACRAEPVEDRGMVNSHNKAHLEHLERILLGWVDKSVTDAYQKKTFVSALRSNPLKVLETLAMVRIQDLDVKQAILEMDDINERLRFMAKLF